MESALKIVFQPQSIFRVRPIARCTASMPGHAESVLAVCFSPDGKQLASGSGDTTVRLWDLNTQTPDHTCKVYFAKLSVAHFVSHINLSIPLEIPHLVVLACELGSTYTGKRGLPMQGHKNWVLCLAWSPDAKMLASGGMDGSIWLWRPDSDQALGSCKGECFLGHSHCQEH